MSEEITTTSWGTRIKNAFIGIGVGIILIIAAIILIFWNEKHSLHMAESLKEAQKILVTVPNSPINPQNNAKVVYFTGLATTTDKLVDSILGIDANAIKLDRKVQMYQWKEHVETQTQSQMGGGEKQTKTYTYTKTWSDNLIDSSTFREQEGHQNPAVMLVQSQVQYANKVTVGDYILPSVLVSQIDVSKAIELTDANKDKLKARLNRPVELSNNELYVGADPQNPQLGDLKITSSAVYPQDVSVIAQQSGTTVDAYLAPAGETVMLLATGIVSSTQMISNALSENKMLTWILRGVTFVMLVVGFSLLLGPIVALADVLPFLGSIVGAGTGFIGFVLGLAVWIIATSIAWFATRPIFAVGIAVVVVALSYMLIKMKKQKSA